MSINILTEKIPIEILYKLLDENCFIKTDKYYELNIETYKKILINNQLQPFFGLFSLNPFNLRNTGISCPKLLKLLAVVFINYPFLQCQYRY